MSLSYSAAQVRAQDIDRFHLAQKAPTSAQEGWLALAAFSLELARTASRVSDPNLGLIRLQWWREVLEELEGGGPVRAHQVALDLQRVAPRLHMSLLHQMVRAREADLQPDAPMALEDLRAYLMQTYGSLLCAQAHMLPLEEGAEGMANHLGCAHGFISLARGLAVGQRPRQPADWQEAPLLGIETALVQAVLHMDRAEELHQEAKNIKQLRPIFATASLVRAWLKIFEQTANPLGQARFARPLPFQALRLAFA